MLYPLSYEGLLVRFAQHAGRVVVRWLGLAASLQTVCAAPVPRAVDQLSLPPRHAAPIVRRVVSSLELEAAQTDEATTWLLLAVVVLVGSGGMGTGFAPLLGKTTNCEKPDFPSLARGPAVVGQRACCGLLVVLVASCCVLLRLDAT